MSYPLTSSPFFDLNARSTRRRTLRTLASCALLAALIGGGVRDAHATLIASETFTGTGYNNAATITGLNGGVGWAGAWAGGSSGDTILTNGLTYSSGAGVLSASGGKLQLVGGTPYRYFATGTGSAAQLAGVVDSSGNIGAPGTSVWVAFMGQCPVVGGDSGITFTRPGASYGVPQTGILALGGPENWRFWPAQNSTGIGAGNQILLVWRIDYGASSDSVHVWYNPTPGTLPADGSANLTYGSEDWSFNEITFGANSSTTMWFDELRVGTTYGDVVPVVTTPPAIPSNPAPANAANNVSTATTLDWADSLGAASYDVYLWLTSGTAPASPNATVTASTWTPSGFLTPLTNYSWRVVAGNQFGTTNGPTWTFTTGDGRPAAPSSPTPASGASNVLVDAPLDWTDSLGASGYLVYVWPSSGSQPSTPTAAVAGSSYLPSPPLSGATNYSWQVIATNAYGSTTGAVWTFSTGDRYPGYLVPWPASVTMRSGDFQISGATRIVAANASLLRLATVMTNDIFMATGLHLAALQGTPQTGDICLTNNTSLVGEAYTLDVSSSNIVLAGSNYQAVAWASVTLLQALNTSASPVTVPQMLISDAPAAPMRTVMWDIGRFFHPLPTLYELVDLHRMYKVVYMHLYMSADSLFTFGTAAFPALTNGNVSGSSSAGFYWPTTGSRLYYTKAELTNLVQYATDRGVVIVPEIDTPAWAAYITGHDKADFCSVGGATATTYINVNYSNAVTSMATLMGELADVFNTSPYIHIGADEADTSQFPTYPYWATSSAANNYANGNEAILWYMNKLNSFAAARGQTTWAWSAPGPISKGYDLPTSLVYTAWGYDDGQGPSALGYSVMRAAGGHVMGYGQGSRSAPYNRCLLYRPAQGIYNRLIPLLRFIGAPDNIYTDLTPSFLPLTGHENKIKGAHIMEWETAYEVEVPAMRLSMPALGEPTWNQTSASRLNWDNFLVRQGRTDQLYQRVMRPVVLSVTTQVDPKDICFTAGGMVTMTSAVPGTIRYTVGTSYASSWYNFPTASSTAYTAPFSISQSSVISARLFDANGVPLGNPVTRGFYLITPKAHYKYYFTGDPAPSNFESGTPIVSSVMGQMDGSAPQEDVRYGDTFHRTVYSGSLTASAGAYTFAAAFSGGAIYIDRVLVPDGVATTLTAGEHLFKIVTPASGLGTPYTFSGPGYAAGSDINVLAKTLATASQVFPASYAFGTLGTGDGASAVQLVTIVNHNVFSNMVVSSVSLTGANAGDFVISQDTGETVLAPGAERVVGVRFDPSTVGSKTASVHVVAALLSGGAADVSLTGTAVSSSPPATPTTPSPTNAATGVDAYGTLDWADSIGATGYAIYLWPASGSQPGTPTATVTASQWTPSSPLAYSTAYNWQVVATNSYGSTPGAVWTFTTQPPQPPTTPVTPSPANGATGVDIGTTLDWADSTAANSYYVWLWPASGSKPSTPSGTVSASQWTPPANLAYGTGYSWQVVATNAYGSSTGAVWTFTTAPLNFYVWTGLSGTDARWNRTANWNPNTSFPQTTNDVAIFAGSTRPTVTLNANRTANSVIFSNTTAAFTLAAGSTLSLADGGMIDVQNTTSQNNNTIACGVAMLGSLTVTNEKAGNVLTISGLLSGSGILSIGGAGQTVLSVNGNSDQVGGLVSSGTPSTALVKNGASSAATLTINNAADCVFNGSMADGSTGVLNITKTGGGAFIITGPCTNTGAWSIGAGTLGGTGTVAGVVTVLSGATLSPGAGGLNAGTLTATSNLVLNAGAVLNLHLGVPGVVGGTANDLVTVGRNLTLDGTLNVTGLSGFETATAGSSWRLFNYSGSLTDNGLTLGAIPGSGNTYAIDTSHTNQVNLIVLTSANVPAVPAYVAPANGATGVSLNTSLTWSGASAATGYKVYFWPTSGSKPATPNAMTADTSWVPGGNLSFSNSFSWQVVATNIYGSATGAVWTFATTTNTVQVTNIANGTTLRYPLVLVSGVYDGQSLAVTTSPTNAGTSLTTYGTRFRCLVDLQPGANTITITDGHGPVPLSLTYTPTTLTSYRYKMWYVVPSDEASAPVDPNYYTHFGLQSKLMQSWMAEDQLRGGHGRTTYYMEMDSTNNVNVGYLIISQTRAQAEALGDGIFNTVYSQIPAPYNNGNYKNVVFSSVNFHALESGYMAYVGAYTNIHPNNVSGMMGALLSTAVGNDGVLTYATYAGVTLHEICHTINSIWHDYNYPSIMSGTDYDISEYFTLTYSVSNPTPHNESAAGTLGNQRDLAAWSRYLMSADPQTYNNATVSIATGPEYLTASSTYPIAVFYYYIPDSTQDLHTNVWTLGSTTCRKHLGRAIQELGNYPFNIMAVDTQGNMSYTTFSGGTIPVVPVNDSYAVSGTTVIAAPGVLSNDINPSGNTLTAMLATNAQHGALTFNANGGFTYTPGLGFTGSDTFWYTAVDSVSSDQQARVTLTGPLMPPTLPATPAPADAATGVSVSTTFDWADSTGATGYRVFLWLTSQSKPATPTATVAASAYSPSGSLIAGTNYSWQVVATNTSGSSTGAVWTFTTGTVVPPLVVSAGSPQTATPSVPSVTIGGSPTASGGSGVYSYSWAPTTGLSSATVANPTASPTATTTYTVTVTDSLSTTATSSVVITYTVPPLVASAGANQAASPSVPTVTIGGSPTASGGKPGYTYSWTPTTGLSGATVANPTASPTATTTYTVTVTDSLSTTATSSVVITYTVPALVVNAGAAQTVTPSAPSVTIGGSPTASGGKPGYTYSWTPTTGLSSATVANPTASPTTTTTYTVTVTDSLSTTGTSSVIVTYSAGNAALVSIDFIYSDLNSGSPSSPYSGDTTLTGTLDKNAAGQIYTNQVGSWNTLNLGGNNDTVSSASLTNIHNGAGGLTTVSFAMGSATTAGGSGGDWRNNYLTTTGGNLREEQAYLYPGVITGNSFVWELAGLTTNGHYRLTVFASPGGDSNVANSVAGAQDSEGDWDWTNITATAAGRITGTYTATSGTPGIYGLQVEAIPALPTKLVYITVPTTGVAGTPFSVTVQSQDATGKPASPTSDTTITLSKATGAGTLSGTVTGIIPASGNSVTITTPVYSKSDTMTLTASATVGMTSLTPVTSSNIVFSAGAAAATSVETAANGSGSVVGAQNISSGNSITVYAVVRDANGNYVGNPSAVWSLQGSTGGVVAGDLVAGGASAVFTGHLVGTTTIRAVAAGFTGNSGLQTVIAGTATQLAYTAVPGTGVAGTPFGVTLQSRDANGNPANPTNTTTITLSKAMGGGSLSGLLTGTIGTSTDSVTIATPVYSKSDTMTLTASATAGMTSLTPVTSGPIVFSAGAAAATTVETAANGSGSAVGAQNITAGNAITVYAITRDANGNYVGNPSATWSLQGSTGGVVAGDLAAGGASAVFTGHLVGSTTIRAVASGFTGNSGLQTVIAGTATQLAYTTVPGSGVAGTPFSVTVQSRDANGNPANLASATTITLSKATGAGTLSGTLAGSIGSGANSVTIATPVYSKADTMMLTAAASGGVTLTPVTSGSIVFSAGAVSAAASTVAASPATVPADGATTSTITVTLLDANGNPVAGKAVTLASSRAGLDAISAASGASTASGVVTFTVTSTTAGWPVFTATDTADSLTVSPSAATVTYTAVSMGLVSLDVVANGSVAVSGDVTGGLTGQSGPWNALPLNGSTITLSNLTNGTGAPTSAGFVFDVAGVGYHVQVAGSPYNPGRVLGTDDPERSWITGGEAPVTFKFTGITVGSQCALAVYTTGNPLMTLTINGTAYPNPGMLLITTNTANSSGEVVGVVSCGGAADDGYAELSGFQLELATATQPPVLPLSGFSLLNGVPTFAIPNTALPSQYTLFYKDNLTDATWTPLGGSGTAPGNGGTLTLSDPTTVGALPANRYYRLQRNP